MGSGVNGVLSESHFRENFGRFFEEGESIEKIESKSGVANPNDFVITTKTFAQKINVSVKHGSLDFCNPSPKHYTLDFDSLKEKSLEMIRQVHVERLRNEFEKNKEPTYLKLKKFWKEEVVRGYNAKTTDEKRSLLFFLFGAYNDDKKIHYVMDYNLQNKKIRKQKMDWFRYHDFFMREENLARITFEANPHTDYVYVKFDHNLIGKIQVKFTNGLPVITSKSLGRRDNFWIEEHFFNAFVIDKEEVQIE